MLGTTFSVIRPLVCEDKNNVNTNKKFMTIG